MKVILDIKDQNCHSLMQVLNSLPYVKTKELTPCKSKILEDVKQAVEEMNLIKRDKYS